MRNQVHTNKSSNRFGEQRIEAVSSTYRVSISDANTDTQIQFLVESTLEVDDWEWSSVPDLRLRDPRGE